MFDLEGNSQSQNFKAQDTIRCYMVFCNIYLGTALDLNSFEELLIVSTARMHSPKTLIEKAKKRRRKSKKAKSDYKNGPGDSL